MEVDLGKLVEELELVPYQGAVFLNRRTGEFFGFTDAILRGVEDSDEFELLEGWEQEEAIKARELLCSDDFLELPSRWEIHEYEIMRRFCRGREAGELRRELIDAIRGKGAFGRFKLAISRHDLGQDWQVFRSRALEAIAAECLEEHDVPFRCSDPGPSDP